MRLSSVWACKPFFHVQTTQLLEIEPLDSGDARVKMRDGGMVPVSRRYRDNLRKVAE